MTDDVLRVLQVAHVDDCLMSKPSGGSDICAIIFFRIDLKSGYPKINRFFNGYLCTFRKHTALKFMAKHEPIFGLAELNSPPVLGSRHAALHIGRFQQGNPLSSDLAIINSREDGKVSRCYTSVSIEHENDGLCQANSENCRG